MHRVGPAIVGGVIYYPGAQAAQVLAGWRDATAGAPDELTTLVNLTTAQPALSLPRDTQGTKVAALVACWAGPQDDGLEVVRPLRTLGTPLADLLAPMPYLTLQQLVDPLCGPGAANYFTSAFIDDLPDAAIQIFADAHQRSTGPPAACELHIHQLGGAMARVAPDATAFSQRQPRYLINCITRTPTTDGFAAHRAWARDARDAMAQVRGGPGVRQLHRRGRSRQHPRVLSSPNPCPADRGQATLRPRQPVPLRSQHPLHMARADDEAAARADMNIVLHRLTLALTASA